MSGINVEDVKEEGVAADSLKKYVDDEKSALERSDETPMPSAQQEEEIIKKKYGGILPKKPPLISKDHERAFFDSADWALGKQGAQKPKGPLEALRPKLQPTPHHQVRYRRSAYAPAGEEEADGGDSNATTSSQEQSSALDGGENNNKTADEQSSRE